MIKNSANKYFPKIQATCIGLPLAKLLPVHGTNLRHLACPARFPSINLRPAWALDKIDILGQDFANATCPALIFCLARSALTAAWPCLTLACMDLIRC